MELIIHSLISIWKVPEYLSDVPNRAGMAHCHMLTPSDHSVCTDCCRVISRSQRCQTVSFILLADAILLDFIIYICRRYYTTSVMTVIFTTHSSKFVRNRYFGTSHYLWYILNCNFKQIKME